MSWPKLISVRRLAVTLCIVVVLTVAAKLSHKASMEHEDAFDEVQSWRLCDGRSAERFEGCMSTQQRDGECLLIQVAGDFPATLDELREAFPGLDEYAAKCVVFSQWHQ